MFFRRVSMYLGSTDFRKLNATDMSNCDCFTDTLTASPQDSLAPKPNFVDIFTASSPRYSAATYFLPSGVLCA